MKRLISTLLAVAVLIGCMAFSATPATAVKVASAKLTASAVTAHTDTTGGTVTVTISLNDNPGIWSALIELGFNAEAIVPVSITEGCEVWAADELTASALTKNPLTMYFESGSLSNLTGNGKLVTIVFNVIDSTKTFDFTLTYDQENTISIAEGYNGEDVQLDIFNEIPADIHSWSIAVTTDENPSPNDMCTVVHTCLVCGLIKSEQKVFLLGDINWDGSVNGKDENYMTFHICGDMPNIDIKPADLNKDDRIDGKDGNLMRQIIIGDWNPNYISD